MTLATLREFCLSLPDTAEEIKWGQDLVFTVGKRMFCIVNTEPPNQLSFKTTPEDFAELVERPGIRPAPYLARAVWVQEEQFGEALEHEDVERLVRQAYELVRAKLPKERVATAKAVKKAPTKSRGTSRAKAGAKRSVKARPKASAKTRVKGTSAQASRRR